jgi:hypothetical protein
MQKTDAMKSRLLFAVLLLMRFSSMAPAQTPSDFTTTTSNGDITITSYIGSASTVVIPGTINDLPVTGIAAGVFDGSYSATSLTIPSSVVSIGQGAFDLWTTLTSITVDQSNPAYSSVSGILFNKDRTTLIKYPAAKVGNRYAIPRSVTSIGEHAFFYCANLTSVVISQSVTSIGIGAFISCTGLTDVTIPNGVTTIEEGTFYNCNSLADVVIPNSITAIGDSAFAFCYVLASITIPDAVTSIGVGTFQNCYTLTNVTIGNGVMSIGANAFESCEDLSNLTIGDSVASIGSDAFEGCINLTSVTIPASVTSIGSSAFISNIVYTTFGNEVTGVKRAIFLGNAPTMGQSVFGYLNSLGSALTTSSVTVYYYPGATGFTSPNWTDSGGDTYHAYPVETFSQWVDSYNISSVATSTPLNDGVPNLLKYFFGINPTVPMTTADRAALPLVGSTTTSGISYLTLTYRQDLGEMGLTVNVQTSFDLQSWTTVTNPAITQTGTDFNTGEPIMQAQVPFTGEKEFIRLNVTSP